MVVKRKRAPKVLLSIPKEPEPQEQPPPKGTIQFWSGEFGNQYTARNRVNWQERVPFWEQIIDRTSAKTFLDVGCNAGRYSRGVCGTHGCRNA